MPSDNMVYMLLVGIYILLLASISIFEVILKSLGIVFCICQAKITQWNHVFFFVACFHTLDYVLVLLSFTLLNAFTIGSNI